MPTRADGTDCNDAHEVFLAKLRRYDSLMQIDRGEMMSITGQTSWEELKAVLNVGDEVSGVVLKHEAFGVFVDIGCGFDGLIEIIAFRDEGIMTPDMFPAVGAQVKAKVLGFRESNNQIWLSIKPSQWSSSPGGASARPQDAQE